METLAALERRSALRILWILDETPRMMTRELLSRVGCGEAAVYSALPILNKLGLITEEREPQFNRRWHRLTEKGRAVVAKLREMNAILVQQ